jgi:hypothetical protein
MLGHGLLYLGGDAVKGELELSAELRHVILPHLITHINTVDALQ